MIYIPEFTELVPTRKQSELACALDSGQSTPDDKSTVKHKRMRPHFEASSVKGRPMLVGDVAEGPYVEFEGLTRLCCVYSAKVRLRERPDGLPAVLGV